MTLEERTEAAREYENLARHMVGTRLELARKYNLERAKFLRGEVKRIADTAPNFAEEIGLAEFRDQ